MFIAEPANDAKPPIMNESAMDCAVNSVSPSNCSPNVSRNITMYALSTRKSDVSWNTSSKPSLIKSLPKRLRPSFVKSLDKLPLTERPNTKLSNALPPSILAKPISTIYCKADFMLALLSIAADGTLAPFDDISL